MSDPVGEFIVIVVNTVTSRGPGRKFCRGINKIKTQAMRRNSKREKPSLRDTKYHTISFCQNINSLLRIRNNQWDHSSAFRKLDTLVGPFSMLVVARNEIRQLAIK